MAPTHRHDPKVDRLGTVPLFSGLERRHLDRVASLCAQVDVGAGQVLCRQGELGQEFFVISDGTAEVSVDGRTVATLGPGDFFGELALIDGGTRIATVTATSPMELFVLSRAEFAGVLADEPSVAARMLTAVGARLREAQSGQPVGV